MTEAEEHKKKLRIAKRIIRSTKNTSTSHLQRKMGIGYNYADRLMEEISKLHGFRFVRKARKR
ncbi:MAG: DNA translocase FtsK [Campylobacterota bacterium]|nr:DNA translocase FtsK [Campylobacterota bacterium]